MMKKFNIRVYGILLNSANEVLISDERQKGLEFTKFPGGGLEYGEGLVDGLIREFEEECQLAVQVGRHVHTSEHFVRSVFDESQVIAVHYEVSTKGEPTGRFANRQFDFTSNASDDQVFRWIPLSEFNAGELTFDIDREAWHRFVSQRNS